MTGVRVERRGPAAWITLDRPDAGNAIDMALAEALDAATREAASDPAVRCVVLTGAGRLFCAGGDVAAFAAAGADAPRLLRDLADAVHRSVLTLATMAKPLLVVVNGPAAGAGLSLALLGDVVLAGARAHFTPAYSAIGLTPDGGMSWLLPRCVGLRRAQTMILLNERVDAEPAAAIGLVTRTVSNDALTLEAEAVAERLCAAPTAALGAARALLLDGATADLAAHLDHEAATIAAAGATRHFHEGLAAFLARRPPAFHGEFHA